MMYNFNKSILAILVCLLISQSTTVFADVKSCAHSAFENTQKLHESHLKNNYKTHRNLTDYKRELGQSFLEFLRALLPGQRWLDAGGGQAQAIKDYLSEFPADGSPAHTSVVVVKKPDQFSPPTTHAEKLSYHEGRYIEDILATELGKFDLITDMYGPLYYSLHIDRVVAKYIELLSENGRIYFNGFFCSSLSRAAPEITLANGQKIGFIEWLQTIDGLQVEEVSGTNSMGYMITVRPGAKPLIPQLELIQTTFFGMMPKRIYRER